MKIHALEIRPVAGYDRRVHAGAFARAVDTVMNFDGVGEREATSRIMAELETGELRLKVEGGHAAYQYARKR